MKKFLTSIIGLFTRNWGLKLLALVLALVIYHSLKSSNNQKFGNSGTQNDRSLFQSR